MHPIRLVLLILALAALAACGSEAGNTGERDIVPGIDVPPLDGFGDSGALPDLPPGEGTKTDDGAPELPPEEGQFGAPCQGNEDCASSFCIPTPNGQVCTRYCVDACDPGWTCKAISNDGTDVTYVCVPIHATLCDPCWKHSDCSS